jgi:hypothetical protein
MSSRPSLTQALGDARKVAFMGLAKNTGKTVAVNTLIGELVARGRSLGITSIGRDGEEFDAIQPQVKKPPISCPAGTLVATTQPLMRRSSAVHEVLVETDVRTPLGRVVIVRLLRAGRCEIAGPSSSAELQAITEEMLARGADSVIVDGSIDRRAAAAPPIADAVVVATGAVLGSEIEDVVAVTAQVFGWATIAQVEDPRTRDLAEASPNRSLLAVAEDVIPLPSAFALTVEPRDLLSLLGAAIEPVLLVGGVLPESLLEGLLPHGRRSRVRVVASDPTKVFVKTKSAEWYRRRGVLVEVLKRARLGAVTVNPLKPPTQRLDSKRLCQAIGESLRNRVPVMDVLDPGYRASELIEAG